MHLQGLAQIVGRQLQAVGLTAGQGSILQQRCKLGQDIMLSLRLNMRAAEKLTDFQKS